MPGIGRSVMLLPIVDGIADEIVANVPRALVRGGTGYPVGADLAARLEPLESDDLGGRRLLLSRRRNSRLGRWWHGETEHATLDVFALPAADLAERKVMPDSASAARIDALVATTRSHLAGLCLLWPLDLTNRAAEQKPVDAQIGGALAVAEAVASTVRRLPVTVALTGFEEYVTQWECTAEPRRRLAFDERGAAEPSAYAPEAIQACVAQALRNGHSLRAAVATLRRLFGEVDLLPVSVAGILKGFNEANHLPLDPRTGGGHSVLVGPDGEGVLAELGIPAAGTLDALGDVYYDDWIPLMIADPFIHFAFGLRHERFVRAGAVSNFGDA